MCEPARVTAIKQGHWQIENRPHYVKDVALSEDERMLLHFIALTSPIAAASAARSHC